MSAELPDLVAVGPPPGAVFEQMYDANRARRTIWLVVPDGRRCALGELGELLLVTSTDGRVLVDWAAVRAARPDLWEVP